VPVERIENAAAIPFAIAVFLEWADPGSGEAQRVEVGRFSVHPPDRAGRYALDAANALAQVPADSPDAALVIQLEPLGAAQPLDGLRVELGPVAWR
jgi:hypothetical protein